MTHCKHFCCNSYDFLLCLIPRCMQNVLLTTNRCIQQICTMIQVLLISCTIYNFLSYMANGCSLIQVCPISQRRYILFPELFATTCRIGQKDVAWLKYIKLVVVLMANTSMGLKDVTCTSNLSYFLITTTTLQVSLKTHFLPLYEASLTKCISMQ